MANPIKWSSPGTCTVLLDCSSLTNNSRAADGGYNNAASGKHDVYGDYEFLVNFTSAPSQGGKVYLYLVPSVNGVDFADGDVSIEPPVEYRVGYFPLRAVTGPQRVVLRSITLPPALFRHVVLNNSGQTTGGTFSENKLSFTPYNEEIT